MSKRIIALICAIVLVAGALTACGKYQKEKVNGIVIKTQFYSYDGDNYAALIMQNKTGNDCDTEIEVNFLSAAGQQIGSYTIYVEAFAKNATVVRRVRNSEAFETCSYNVKVNTCSMIPIDKNLKVKAKKENGYATFTVKNTAKYPTFDPRYTALFYKGSNLVYIDTGSCDDIYPKMTYNGLVTCPVPFNKVEVYVHGTASING